MKHVFTLSGIFIAICIFFMSCEYEKVEPEKVDISNVDTVSFANEIAPIFDSNCAKCHSGNTSPDLSAENSYNSLTNGYINIESPGESKIMQKIEGDHQTSSNISSTEKALILKWIEDGALDN